MKQLLLSTPLLLTTLAAQAQQPDTLARPAADSLRRIFCGPTFVTEHIALPAFTTIQPALSRIAGVQVTPYSGAPGAWATVRIRGVASVTGSNQPLYVVDGIPVYNMDAKPEDWTGLYRFINATQYAPVEQPVPFSPMGNPLLDLPVADIEQVEVLKGAAATALYGIQGTNGVIRISTRRGADGLVPAQPLRVRYAGWGGLQQVRQRYDLLDTRQYAELANVAARNDGLPPRYTEAEINNLPSVDWQDKAFRVAGMQSHNLSLDGLTTHGTRYYVAADYLRQAGVLINSQLSRYSLRANVEQQLGRKLTVSAKVAGSQLDQKQPGFQSDASSTLTTLLQARPILPTSSPDPYYGFNPLWNLEQVYFQPRTRRLLAQLQLSYQFTPALSLRAYASRERAKLEGNFYQEPVTVPNGPVTSYEQSADSETKTAVYGTELSYHQTLGDRHGLTASLHYQQQQYERSQNQERQTTYTYPNEVVSAGGAYIRTEMKTEPLRNATAAISYVYDKRYELRASMRADFVLATDESKEIHRWFPGAEVRWHLGQEAFLADVTGLSALTVQAGAGRTRSFYSLDQTDHLDAGLHLGVLNNKLALDAQVYRRRTEDAQNTLLAEFPGSNGPIGSYFPHITLQNRGVELTLTGSWQLGPVRGLSTVAVAANQNTVADIRVGDTSVDKLQALEKGQSVSRFFVFEQDGTYPVGSPAAGRIRFRDRNNNGRSDDDGQYQGSGLPRRTLTVFQQLGWKRWQLEAQLDGLFGYQLLNTTLVGLDRPNGNFNASKRALDYWTPTNQNTSVPQPGRAASYGPFSDQNLASGNHVRLSQLALSYEVLNTAARRLSVWVGGQNLFVTGSYRGFDPNVSSGGASPLLAGQDASVYPVARVWQLGIRGQF